MDWGRVLKIEKGKGIQAVGVLDPAEDFFKDHFPDFPILPGVLMLELLSRTAANYFDGAAKRLEEVLNVKYSRYLRPGDEWEAVLEIEAEEGVRSRWKGRLLCKGVAACSARFILTTAIDVV